MPADFNVKSILNDAMSMLKQIDPSGTTGSKAGSVSNYTNSIFTLAENGMAYAEAAEKGEAGAQQKASAITNMVQSLMDVLSSISFGETTNADQVNKKNSKAIDDINKKNQKTVNETEKNLNNITQSIAGSSNKIIDAMKEIEKLGGDTGLIQAAQTKLEEQLKIIEENKAILNGEKEGDKATALSAIEGASAQITTLVGNVNGYKELIEAQNNVVTNAVDNISAQITNSASVIQESLERVQGNITNMQQQGAVNTQVVGKGGVDKATGKGLETAGEALTKVPATAATGSQAIVKGNIKSNTGDTEIKGATQNLTKVTDSIGQMGSDLTNMANLTNAVGRVGKSAIELVGQYESSIKPIITAIGSLENIESGNEALTQAIETYKQGLEATSKTEANNTEKENSEVNKENTNDSDNTNIKFQFDRKVFEVKKEV